MDYQAWRLRMPQCWSCWNMAERAGYGAVVGTPRPLLGDKPLDDALVQATDQSVSPLIKSPLAQTDH